MKKHSVELFFDPATEEVLQLELRRLRDAGLPSPLLQWGMRPHVSLLLGTELETGAEDAIAAFALEHAPLPVTLDVLGTFFGPKTAVILLPVVTRELLDLHARAHERLGPYFEDSDPHYAPGRWVPHCTQSIFLEPDELDATFRHCRSAPFPLTGRFASIGIHATTMDLAREGHDRIVATDYPVVRDLAG